MAGDDAGRGVPQVGAWDMKRIFGLSRVRDEKGVIVKRRINPWVNCIHTLVGAGYETMQVLILEYEEEDNPAECDC